MAKRLDKDETIRYGQAAWNFYEKSQKFKAVKAKFEAIKAEFEEEMESLFHGRTSNSIAITNHNMAGPNNTIKVSRVAKTTIVWDAAKLKKRLPADVAKQVILKDYRITNMRELTKYLKSCGVDPNIFKSFLVVEERVDQDAVDRLGDLGVIMPQQISGCYVVNCAKPYFTVKPKKGDGDG